MMIETKALKICIACAFIVLVGVLPAVNNTDQIELTIIHTEPSYRPPMAPEDLEAVYRPPMAPEDIEKYEGDLHGR